jgi:hypothetical protein
MLHFKSGTKIYRMSSLDLFLKRASYETLEKIKSASFFLKSECVTSMR